MASRKRKRHSENDEHKLKGSPSDNQQLKLTDLHEDVLTEIFSKLNVQELVDIVNASKTFLPSCRRAFLRLYKNEYIQLPFIKMDNNIDFKRSVDALRHFGKDISRVGIQINHNDRNRTDKALCKRITDLVLVTCHKTLIEIKVCGISTDLKICKSFPKLKTLAVCCGSTDISVFQFGKWFPKLENLFLHSISNTATKLNTRRQISLLKRFSLVEEYRENGLDIRKVNDFIRNNPQVKALRLLYGVSACLNGTAMITCNIAATAKEMMSVKLIPFDGYLESLFAQLIIPNECVEHLQLTVENPDEEMCDFIAKCSNLKILELEMNLYAGNYEVFKDAKWVQTAAHIPLTKLELSFEVYNLNFANLYVGLEAIVPYLQRYRTLKTIFVKYRYVNLVMEKVVESFDRIRVKIDFDRWSYSQEILSDFSFFALSRHTCSP